MSPRDHTRSCPSCERELSGREHFGEGGLTVIWKCMCGWASARTVPTASPAASAHGMSAGRSGGREPSAPDALQVRSRKPSGVRAKPVEEAPSGEADPARQKARESGG